MTTSISSQTCVCIHAEKCIDGLYVLLKCKYGYNKVHCSTVKQKEMTGKKTVNGLKVNWIMQVIFLSEDLYI